MTHPITITLSFESTPTSPACERLVVGTPDVVVASIEGELAVGNSGGAFVAWPTGAGFGGFYVAPGQTLQAALEQAAAELADPVDPPAFDDPAEEDMARAMVPLLLAAARAGKEVVS